MSLTGSGCIILDAVATGEAAITVVGKRQVDTVLMDIGLAGELDGIVAAKRIRSSADVPIGFLPGDSQESLFQQVKTTTSSYSPCYKHFR